MEPWVAEYIGIPYLEHGRSRSGCDCWGLVRMVLTEHFSHVLPSLSEEYESVNSELTAALIDRHKPTVQAERVDEFFPGDIVVFRVLGLPSHVGVIVGPNYVLHIERGAASIAERLDSRRICSRIEGIYRVA